MIKKMPIDDMPIPPGEIEDGIYKIQIDWSQAPVVYFHHYHHIFYRLEKNKHRGLDMWALSDCPYDMGTKMVFNADKYRLDECFAIWEKKKDEPLRLGGGEVRVLTNANATAWITVDEYEKQQKFFKEFNDKFISQLIWGIPPDTRTQEEKYKDTLKWAYVMIGDQRKMLMVSNTDMKAYKMDGYNVVEPLEEISYTKFERWCRSMDL